MRIFICIFLIVYRSDEDESDFVFFESAMSLRHHPHMVLECVPLPRELGETAPMYFQKAIQVPNSSHDTVGTRFIEQVEIRFCKTFICILILSKYYLNLDID